ncbi:uncharacterized protein LOC110431080 [Sorghum bicolor]|uniref:uncharacterized protein LOC110431080 n=1 Tax=Sorghum bicolor TaxID=4558 RepID=UPI000B423D30|nr:uncharacterized protein LOC110431080 [Sorghum bicolor]|eukprot:XP_021305449.1 uncharacterized protein LOC110431080 [Sorghum bicolor]
MGCMANYIITRLHPEFAVKDMGPLHFFLNVNMRLHGFDFFLSQTKYAEELLDRVGMLQCKPIATPIDTNFLTITRLDIAYAVQQACLHMHDPWECHIAIVKRILRYIRGTTSHGFHFRDTTSTPMIIAYLDAD